MEKLKIRAMEKIVWGGERQQACPNIIKGQRNEMKVAEELTTSDSTLQLDYTEN